MLQDVFQIETVKLYYRADSRLGQTCELLKPILILEKEVAS